MHLNFKTIAKILLLLDTAQKIILMKKNGIVSKNIIIQFLKVIKNKENKNNKKIN